MYVENISLEFSSVFIDVSVPPHQILVYDASGRDVAGSVGPLLEDNNLVLTCEVRGGEYYEDSILLHHHNVGEISNFHVIMQTLTAIYARVHSDKSIKACNF